MSIAQLNHWLNRLSTKAEAVAALDKILIPAPVTKEEAAQVSQRIGSNNPIHFAPFNAKQIAAARPEAYPVNDWNELIKRVLKREESGVYTNLANSWCYAGLFTDGPKVYCPTLEEWEGLSRVELRVPVGLYRQPFPTTTVIIPDGAFGVVSDLIGTPQFVTVRHWIAPAGKQSGLIAGFLVGDVQERYELDFRIAWIDDGEEHIESRLQKIDNAALNPFGEAVRLKEDEPAAMDKIKRATLNACLLLSQHAPRPLGRSNPEYAAKLAAKAGKRLPAHIQAANAKQLRLMPMLYGFHQHIRVVERETEPDDPNPTGACPPRVPHWRRGHWANLAVGTGRKEHRLHFRAAKLVNEHLLKGPRSNTRVTMTTG